MENEIIKYKAETLVGKYIDLVPVNDTMVEDIVRLRNQSKSIYFLNQNKSLTVQEQRQWIEKYKTSTDDIYWGFFNKEKIIEGTIRLYSIEDKSAEMGSMTADNAIKMSFFHYLEAEKMVVRFAFGILKLNRIYATVRSDNRAIIEATKRGGFHVCGNTYIRGVQYDCFEIINNG